MTFLDRILETKKQEVKKLRSTIPYSVWEEKMALMPQPNSFVQALSNQSPLALIAEIKKASPSKGVIASDFDPIAMAKSYEAGGAHALSVLTDEQYFQGSTAILQSVRAVTYLPILRKDFIIDEWQIYEARAIGADAVLLIVAALTDDQLVSLYRTVQSIGLEALIEVHSLEEWERIRPLHPRLVGVNHRNLHTFEVDLSMTERLSQVIDEDILLISESGIRDHSDVMRVKDFGAKGILVGETLMRYGSEHVKQGIAHLLFGANYK